VFLVGERLRGRHGDRIPGVNPHGVEVFNGTNDDDVVGTVAHDLQLVFLPTDDGFFNENFMGWAKLQTAFDKLVKLLTVVGDSASGTSQREAGAENAGQADVFADLLGFYNGAGDTAFGHVQTDLEHGGLELLAVFGLFDGMGASTDHLDLVAC